MKTLAFTYDIESLDIADVIADVADYFGVNISYAQRAPIPQSLLVEAAPPVVTVNTPMEVVAEIKTQIAAPVHGMQVDASGMPWDARIHSTPAKLTTKNVWRAKRGVSDAYMSQIEGELRKLMALPTPTVAVGLISPAQPVSTPAIPPFGTPEYAAARGAYAHEQAMIAAGGTAPAISQNDLDDYIRGVPKMYTFSPDQSKWVEVYLARRKDAFKEFDTQFGGVVEVKAEGTLGNGAPIYQSPTPTMEQAATLPQVPPPPPAQTEPVTSPVPAATIAPVEAPAAGPTAMEAMVSFPKLMQWIVGNQVAGRLTPTVVCEQAASLGLVDAQGVGSITAINTRMDFAPALVTLLQAQGAV